MEEDPSWNKIHRALMKAGCDDLADIVEACFLPTARFSQLLIGRHAYTHAVIKSMKIL